MIVTEQEPSAGAHPLPNSSIRHGKMKKDGAVDHGSNYPGSGRRESQHEAAFPEVRQEEVNREGGFEGSWCLPGLKFCATLTGLCAPTVSISLMKATY